MPRNTSAEGWRLRQQHFEMITSLIQFRRRFFPLGFAFEIRSEFRVGEYEGLKNMPQKDSCRFLDLIGKAQIGRQKKWFTLHNTTAAIDAWVDDYEGDIRKACGFRFELRG
ncbi:hypothetical protein PanWU01x14_006660 [Parasponia andersonii]|uniref:Uncharacterized protein n=1 Tax=Parasponia andersonii TaxID=3476 RepID=A0A2P5E3U8_PARAD|nr:hypothetical protein PanWU01x14_006660 [Parasponia andersonii]